MTMKCGSGYVAILNGKIVATGETAIEAKAKLLLIKKGKEQK